MNALNLALTLVCVLAIAGGQMLFKMAAKAADPALAVPWQFLNAWLFAALVLYGAATFLWVWLLKVMPLNVVYPFMGLAFVIVPVAAAFFFHEALDWRHLAGGALIAAGVAVASWR